MIAILGGLGAAVLWASSTLTSSRAGRLIGPSATLGWMALVGLIVATPLAFASAPLPTITPASLGWMAGSGGGGVAGLLLAYRGLRVGKVGVVAALSSTEGAIAGLLSVTSGEPITLPVAIMLCVIALGVALVAFTADKAAAEPVAADPPAGEPGVSAVSPEARPSAVGARRLSPGRQAVLFGAGSAVCLGISIYSTGKLGQSMPPLMAILPVRVVGTIAVCLPLALAGRLRMTRPALPMVVFIGLAEVAGNASYVIGAGQSIAVAAVLASQFAAVAAVAAFLLFGERLSIRQRSGVAAIALGVAVLTLVRA